MQKLTSRTGFTLIELLVVIVIIGILVTLAIPQFATFRRKAREAQTAVNTRKIQVALESFGADNNGQYPFRVRYFSPAQFGSPTFDPASSAATISSDPTGSYFSMGVFGGVRVVNSDFSDNTILSATDKNAGRNEHKIIQPYGYTFAQWYQYFNQYSDPLRAGGYLDDYPENPFLRRPMGNILWGYGSKNWQGGGPYVADPSIPFEQVVCTPGDFVYTHFYRVDNGVVRDPPGVKPSAKGYYSKAENIQYPGIYYVDTVDSYQLWSYGELTLNGAMYQAYPNNASGVAVRGSNEPKTDWNKNGNKDLFELGVVEYFKNTTATASGANDSGGKPLEF